ncbi:Rieske 2Fe-2S domain-containing protein [Pseudophaeobacter leonis]|uniref:Rieske 2Fe-2S domain-containing protein n=1 Tax=Pseudophaeobacter leonis TaxID=1144477 RepID=UPI0019D368A0|nr:Rieske 2Fe-2S domain-containing protein [Pseudophaeobacter leonis]
MGNLMRQYWIPIRPSAQILQEDVLPVRVLGEDLVLFRSLKGKVGLVGERCPHRMAKLMYGFPDHDGLRCCYHGWKFDHKGQCIDMPLESAEAAAKSNIKIAAYPAQEMGGLVWAYLGPAPAPQLPPWDLFVQTNAIRQIGIMKLPCNWLQAHENSGDPTHSASLHGEYFKYVLKKAGKLDNLEKGQRDALDARVRLGDGMDSLWFEPSRHGLRKGIKYTKALGAESDHSSEHSTIIFPFLTQTGGPGQVRQEFQIRVPIDDTNTYHINYGCFLGTSEIKAPVQDVIPWYTVPLYDDDGRPVLDNILSQDAHAWIAQGPITDRTKEHLRKTDVPVIQIRKQLEQQLRLLEDGAVPMNVFQQGSDMPDVLHGGKWDVTENSAESASAASASAYNRGYNVYEDANRYGPALPDIIELMHTIDKASRAPKP